MQNINPTLQILLAKFNGQILIPFAAASETIGITQQTARNKLSSGSYPIRTVMVGARRFIHVEDLANFVESLREAKPKRGRPTKAEQMARVARASAQGGAA